MTRSRATAGRAAEITATKRKKLTARNRRRVQNVGIVGVVTKKCDDYDDAAPKLTFGTSRSAGALISKNSRGLKPNMLARIFDGNCAILVLKSRTTAL